MQENTAYQVRLHNITAAVVASPDGVLVECAPVFARFVGVRIEKFRTWIKTRGGSIHSLRPEGEDARTL